MSLRCFVDDLANAATPAEGTVSRPVIGLSEPEARHALASRRLSVGDAVVVFDGRGHEASAAIITAARGHVEVRVDEIRTRPRPLPTLTLAVAMPKGPRQDQLIEKCTELGVAAIQPILTERSVAGVSDHKREKWRRTTIEAAKQSGRCWLPELLRPVPLHEIVGGLSRYDVAVAAMLPDDGGAEPITDWIGRLSGRRSILAFVGPEGGWAPAEAQALLAAGVQPISLGPNVLRIETAAIAVAAIVHAWHSPAGDR
ncbi:MAG: 16S rRNA (uracil(1498)-N(3))-methyltransferase [Planctomycetes bacterium]|nr:16S rRNA (uracil(1498)-N(3))-methyltransferase [Planctomycetota bacterium]